MAVRFEGHAVVSADGMIADGAGEMPDALRNDADWAQFQAALDRSALVVLGRKGHERHPNPGRRRLVLTRALAGLAREAGPGEAWLWNPATISIADALAAIGIDAGTVAIAGGTGAFDLFSPVLTAFVLSEVHDLVLPTGTPAFSAGHPRAILAAHGLVPGPAAPLGPGVTLTRWSR